MRWPAGMLSFDGNGSGGGCAAAQRVGDLVTHAVPDTPAIPPVQSTAEPVLIAHAVTVVLAALVGLGWLTLPNPMIDAIGTGAWLLVSTVAAVIARGKVAPVDGTNRPLGIGDFESYVAGIVRDELAAYPQFRTATGTFGDAR